MYSQTKVILLRNVDGKYIGLSMVNDYIYRPYELSDKSLYEWIQISSKVKTHQDRTEKISDSKT